MKKPFTEPGLLFILLFIPFSAFSQSIFGPIDVYVSKQNPPANNVLYTGILPVSADEGRVIDIGIYDVKGPITIEPMTYTLDGPPCPTYSATGARTPADVQPSTTDTFSGSVKLDDDGMPEPGNMVEAEFSGKDNGYWTKCSDGTRTSFTHTETAKFKIHSMNLVLTQHQAFVCNSQATQIDVQTRYPAAGTGTITWTSRKGKVTVTNGSDAGCQLNFIAAGKDVLVATLDVNGVIFSDSVALDVVELKFAQPIYNYLIPVDDEVDVTTLLTDNSIRDNISWFYNYNRGGETPLDYTKINKKVFNTGDRIVIIARCKDMATCQASTELRFYHMDLKIPVCQVCDGKEMPFSIVVRPAVPDAIRNQLLSTVTDLVPRYALRHRSYGNPLGNTNLTFEPFNATWESKVKNMIWYANVPDLCNDLSDYKLWVQGKINGKDIFSFYYVITADVDPGKPCVNGEAKPSRKWSGEPVFRTRWDSTARKWCGWIDNVGSFKRDVKCTTTNVTPANSQWRAIVDAEENYHVGQIEGTTSKLCDSLWNVNNVFRGILHRRYYASTEREALALAKEAFTKQLNLETVRSDAQFAYPSPLRCTLEREAKAKVGVTHRFRYYCAYRLCPQP